jgi:hypothetical protein
MADHATGIAVYGFKCVGVKLGAVQLCVRFAGGKAGAAAGAARKYKQTCSYHELGSCFHFRLQDVAAAAKVADDLKCSESLIFEVSTFAATKAAYTQSRIKLNNNNLLIIQLPSLNRLCDILVFITPGFSWRNGGGWQS